ncbi:heme peroxidase [Glomus cerebriforme]|uniref:Heme peroxidase n=1 Tax=Glomus cerebriforme TaxID=658196 RepID=A0A397SYR4_9GLOM|nr:heme peroxidase [Glomus cerebriforme]
MLFQKNQIIKNITFLVSLSSVFFIKIIESQYNIPDAGVTYTREFPPDPFYPNGMGKMLKTPVDSLSSINAPMIKCTDPLSAGTYPLPRCISDEFAYNLNSGPYPNVERQSILRSKRRTNHMATWFGQFISFDITSSSSTIPSTPIYIPADDAAFNPPGSIPGELPAKGITSLPFNLTETLPGTSDPLNSARNGISYVTPFLDLNMIYGSSDDQLAILRNGTSCKLLTSNDGRFPPKNAEGKYIKGAGTSARSWSLFTLALSTLWIREHNRLCDELFKEHGNSWTDQKYFEEAQRWNVAFFQKATSEEYLGTILGRPLPTYEGYKPELVPGIDTFFATVAFRYGHTELSDIYRIQDEYGDTIVDLTLDQISEESYIETIPYERVLSSMALQRQEEVDPFFSDAPRNVISNSIVYDLYAFDVSRSRDRGIALYNVVREAYGLPRKKTWDEVTSDKYLQDRLQLLYPGGPDSTEAFVGAFCEDHLDGSNFGELLNASIVTQFNRIRETDRFWWESPERSLWTVQPYPELEGENVEKNISPWSLYSIQYSLDNTHIHFQVELKTSGGEGWFGMGFDPSDNGMTNAEFIVGIVKNRDVDLSNYNSNSGYHPPLKQTSEGLEIKSKNIDPNGVAKIEFSRLLRPPNRKPIRNEQMKCT